MRLESQLKMTQGNLEGDLNSKLIEIQQLKAQVKDLEAKLRETRDQMKKE